MRRTTLWTAIVLTFVIAAPEAFARGSSRGRSFRAGGRSFGNRTFGRTRSFSARRFTRSRSPSRARSFNRSRTFGSRSFSRSRTTNRSFGRSRTFGSRRFAGRTTRARTFSNRSFGRTRTTRRSTAPRSLTRNRARSARTFTGSRSRGTLPRARNGRLGTFGRTGFTRSRSSLRSGVRHSLSHHGFRRHRARHSRASHRHRSHSHSHRRHHRHHHHHSFFHRHGFHLSFHFGHGHYFGHRYYYPYHHYVSGYNYAFFYPHRVTYAYVPYGFYCDATPVYVTRRRVIRADYAETDYETRDEAPVDEDGKKADPKPAASSPVTEKYLRDASEAFRKGEYYEAAKTFRLAALSAKGKAAPLFALGQSLVALGHDAYAAKVIRRAVGLDGNLVKEPGDIVGVYRDPAEFARVMGKLEERAAASEAGSDARFLLAVQQYFSGDPRAREGFAALATANPEDAVVGAFRTAVEARFKSAEELPPIDGPTEKRDDKDEAEEIE